MAERLSSKHEILTIIESAVAAAGTPDNLESVRDTAEFALVGLKLLADEVDLLNQRLDDLVATEAIDVASELADLNAQLAKMTKTVKKLSKKKKKS